MMRVVESIMFTCLHDVHEMHKSSFDLRRSFFICHASPCGLSTLIVKKNAVRECVWRCIGALLVVVVVPQRRTHMDDMSSELEFDVLFCIRVECSIFVFVFVVVWVTIYVVCCMFLAGLRCRMSCPRCTRFGCGVHELC